MQLKNMVCLPSKNNCFVYQWEMTKYCNYNCSYCYQKETHEKEFPNIENLKNCAIDIADMLKRHKTNKLKQLSLIGGEVSVLPLDEIIKPIISQIDILNIVSNGSGNLEKVIKLVLDSNKKIIIVLSFHEEFTTIEKFISKANILKEKFGNNKNFSINVILVVTNTNYKLIQEAAKKLDDNNISFDIQPERHDLNLSVTDEEAKKILFINEKECKRRRCVVTDMNDDKKEYINKGTFLLDTQNFTFYGAHCDIHKNFFAIKDGKVCVSECSNLDIPISIKNFNPNCFDSLEYIVCRHKSCPSCRHCNVDFNTEQNIEANKRLTNRLKNYTKK